MGSAGVLLGVIGDTRGLVRPEVLEALAGCDLILHAGGIGGPHVLEALGAVAPVRAVRGRVDEAAHLRAQPERPDFAVDWAASLPRCDAIRLEGVLVHVLHRLEDLDVDPAAEGFDVVVSADARGPRVHQRNGVLHVSPGSAGPPSPSAPGTVARLRLHDGEAEAELVKLG
jgi:predicted phosphodiesterase